MSGGPKLITTLKLMEFCKLLGGMLAKVVMSQFTGSWSF